MRKFQSKYLTARIMCYAPRPYHWLRFFGRITQWRRHLGSKKMRWNQSIQSCSLTKVWGQRTQQPRLTLFWAQGPCRGERNARGRTKKVQVAKRHRRGQSCPRPTEIIRRKSGMPLKAASQGIPRKRTNTVGQP